jgi:hypothetical protein
MTKNEFKKLIEAGVIRNVMLTGEYDDKDRLVWSVSASDYLPDNTEIEHGQSPGWSDTWKNSSRDQNYKIFTSLDRARAAIRKLGYIDTISIEG